MSAKRFVSSLVAVASLVTFGPAAEPPKDAPLDNKFLRDYAETRGFMLGRPVSPKPTPDGKAVLFLRARARSPKMSLFEFDVATGKTRELLTPEKLLKGAEETLSPEEKARRERMRITVGGFTGFQLSDDGKLVLLSLSGKLYVLDRLSGKARELKTGPGTILDPKFSPNGKMVAFVRDYDVYVYDLTTQKEHRVTTGGTERVSHGLAEFVAQEEMGRFSGYWWSPDSKFIAYEEADATAVETWHVADPAKPDQPPQPFFYPRPGKANVKARVGVIPIAGGQTAWIKWDVKKYPYLAQVRWDKHGPLTLTIQTRLQHELVLLKADPATGKTTPLLTAKNPAWLNLYQEVPHWLTDGKSFLWVSEDEDGPYLAIHEPDGKLRHELAATRHYRGLVSAEPKTDRVVFLASVDSGEPREVAPGAQKVSAYTRQPDPSRVEVLSVGADKQFGTSSPVVGVDVGIGVKSAIFSKDHSIFVLTTTALNEMPRSLVFKKDGTAIGELPSLAESPRSRPRITIQEVGTGHGNLFTAVVRPHGFDLKKRYPVIVHVYGGPHHLQVEDAMNRWLLDQWLADQGFIVVAIDGRGTPGRGRDWERAISKKFGSVPLEDQVAGLQALGKKFPEMDLDRVGVVGWSFGGYMSGLAVLKRPDIFKAAVAGAPVVDWLDYDTHYTERYLGLPDQDAAAYKEASLLTYAADLKRPLLLIHGTTDDNVYFRHSLKLADALFRAGKEFELLPLSGFTHLVPDPVVMERLETRIASFFQKHLGKPTGRSMPAR